MPQTTIMLIAGEASGDLHAANLVNALKALNPKVRCIGMGMVKMREAGVELLVDSATLAVVGLVEVLVHYPALKSALKNLQRAIIKDPPDLLILVDYPDFNLKLAATAKQVGVKVLYYISPQIWAWRKGRLKKIRQLVDMMAVVFPFEVPLYESAQVPVRFTGHPLVDEVKATITREQARAHFGLVREQKVVGLFPGSRQSEIKRLMPIVLRAAALLRRQFPELQLILPIAPGLQATDIVRRIEASHIPIVLAEHEVYNVIQSCDAIITASGTATLQIALLGVPMVIIYRVSPLSYWIARWLITVKHVGLVNIVLDEPAVGEFIQHDAKPQWIAKETARLLTDQTYASQMRRALAQVKKKLGKGRGLEQVAKLACEMMQSNTPSEDCHVRENSETHP